MLKNIQYILFHLLLSLRGIIRLVCRTVTLLSIFGSIGGAVLLENKTLVGYFLPFLVVGIISWLITIYYDKLLFKIKPSDMDLYLS